MGMKPILINWLPALFGILAGAVELYRGGMTWKAALAAAAFAALGLSAKQRNVTGGTKPQPTPPEVEAAKVVPAKGA